MLGGAHMMMPMLSDGGAAGIVLLIGMIGFAIVEIGAMLAFFGNAALIGFAASAWIPFYLIKGRPPGHWLWRPVLVMSLMLILAAIYVGGAFSLMLTAGDLISDDPDSVSVGLALLGVGFSVGAGAFVLLGLVRDRVRHVLGMGRHVPGKAGRFLAGMLKIGLGLGSTCIVGAVVGVFLSDLGTVGAPAFVLALAACGALVMVIADAKGVAFFRATVDILPASRFRWVLGELMLWIGSIGLGAMLIVGAATVAAGAFGLASLVCIGLCLVVPLGMLKLSRIGGPLRAPALSATLEVGGLDLHGENAVAREE